jgi:hypothetical protein
VRSSRTNITIKGCRQLPVAGHAVVATISFLCCELAVEFVDETISRSRPIAFFSEKPVPIASGGNRRWAAHGFKVLASVDS